MNFNVIDTACRSICIELECDSPYEPDAEVLISLNGEKYGAYKKSVITINDLEPDTEYEIKAESCDKVASRNIRTCRESVLLDVKDFGALGDGRTNDTSFLQAAVCACPKEGTVYIGKGTYLSGPLFLKSDINLWIDKDAVLLGITDRKAYPVLQGMTGTTDERDEYNLGSWEGNPLSCFASLITGIDIQNVRIFGDGVIDGNAQNGDWWVNPKEKRGAFRPRLIFLNRCKNITLQGVTVQNSPSWTIHPYYSDDINILGLTIRNPDNSPNTDGIDPESCCNVNIIGTDISVGDDCIAIKSGKYYMALRHYKKTENINIRNCRLNRGHGSVTVGSECAGGVDKVAVSKCIFDSTDRGLRIKTRRGRGKRSILENIVFTDILMRDVKMPFTVNMFYFCDPDGHSEYCQTRKKLEVNDMTPVIRNICARNINCTDAEVSFITVYGLPESKVEEVRIENVNVSFKDKSLRNAAAPVMMDDIEEMSGKGIYVRNVQKLIIKDVLISNSDDESIDEDNIDEKLVEHLEFK